MEIIFFWPDLARITLTSSKFLFYPVDQTPLTFLNFAQLGGFWEILLKPKYMMEDGRPRNLKCLDKESEKLSWR